MHVLVINDAHGYVGVDDDDLTVNLPPDDDYDLDDDEAFAEATLQRIKTQEKIIQQLSNRCPCLDQDDDDMLPLPGEPTRNEDEQSKRAELVYRQVECSACDGTGHVGHPHDPDLTVWCNHCQGKGYNVVSATPATEAENDLLEPFAGWADPYRHPTPKAGWARRPPGVA